MAKIIAISLLILLSTLCCTQTEPQTSESRKPTLSTQKEVDSKAQTTTQKIKHTTTKNKKASSPPSITTVKQYVDKYRGIAQKVSRETGIPTSILLARGAIFYFNGGKLENLSIKTNNHFGTQCFTNHKNQNKHCIQNSSKLFFVQYQTVEQSYKQQATYILQRISYATKYGDDYRCWAFSIATFEKAYGDNYAEKLIGVIQRYDLDRYDLNK